MKASLCLRKEEGFKFCHQNSNGSHLRSSQGGDKHPPSPRPASPIHSGPFCSAQMGLQDPSTGGPGGCSEQGWDCGARPFTTRDTETAVQRGLGTCPGSVSPAWDVSPDSRLNASPPLRAGSTAVLRRSGREAPSFQLPPTPHPENCPLPTLTQPAKQTPKPGGCSWAPAS